MAVKLLRSIVVTVLLCALGTVSAAADTSATGTGMTITVPSTATVTARVAVSVNVGVQCTAPDLSQYIITYPATVFFNTGAVSISQAFGTRVNTAIAGFGPIVCDGNSYTYPVLVVAGTAPWHAGPAAISASAEWTEEWGGCLVSDPTNCGFFMVTDSASVTGLVTMTG